MTILDFGRINSEDHISTFSDLRRMMGMDKAHLICIGDTSVLTSDKPRGSGEKKMPSARLKVDFSDPPTSVAIKALEDAGCSVTTIPVNAQPFPELLVGGQYYRGLEQINAIAGEIKSLFKIDS
jgi:hypothetical protein